jgi:hypothetical protein
MGFSIAAWRQQLRSGLCPASGIMDGNTTALIGSTQDSLNIGVAHFHSITDQIGFPRRSELIGENDVSLRNADYLIVGNNPCSFLYNAAGNFKI